MNSWQRIFAFISGSLVFGLLIILLSNNYIQYVTEPGTAGYFFLIGFGLVFLNLNFGASRRFVIKAPNAIWVCYLMTILTIAPALFWIYTKDVGLANMETLFVVIIIFSALLGTYFGIRRGRVKRQKYLRRLQEEQEQPMPDELQRPHDELSNN
ncbi:MAG TPA: hypothetical protein VK112_04870 [Fodinibius sp.]|nr:hypothetical protein [Fodinibius sp.]